MRNTIKIYVYLNLSASGLWRHCDAALSQGVQHDTGRMMVTLRKDLVFTKKLIWLFHKVTYCRLLALIRIIILPVYGKAGKRIPSPYIVPTMSC